MIRERKVCRLCNAAVRTVFALAPTPIANNYAEKPDTAARRYPLELTECGRCHHVQQRFVIDGLFQDYKYTTPQTVATYLMPVANLLRERHPKARKVLEIGSNNGTYLTVLREAGFDATGIDPAATGECNIEGYFNLSWAQKHNVKYDLIVANNVLAHIDNLTDVFHGIEWLLTEGGALVFEVQYWPALVNEAAFDLLYFEHMSCHALAPLAPFLRRMGLVMTRVDFIQTHGGSIRVTAERAGLEAWFLEEPTDWAKFSDNVNRRKEQIRRKVDGRKLVAFGAAAKATTLIHACGIADHFLYCVDDTPEKHYRYIPGTNIQILPTDRVNDGEPLFMFAWNYFKEIREKYPTSELIHPFDENIDSERAQKTA